MTPATPQPALAPKEDIKLLKLHLFKDSLMKNLRAKWNMKSSSSGTYTFTPEQIEDFSDKLMLQLLEEEESTLPVSFKIKNLNDKMVQGGLNEREKLDFYYLVSGMLDILLFGKGEGEGEGDGELI